MMSWYCAPHSAHAAAPAQAGLTTQGLLGRVIAPSAGPGEMMARHDLDIQWSRVMPPAQHTFSHHPTQPAQRSHTQTASRLESHHQSPDLVITTFISLSSKYLRDTQNVWLGMWFTVTLPGSVWWWDHDRSDHWANIVFPVTMWDTGRSCVTSEPCHPQCDTFHITDVMTFLSHVAKSLNDGDILFLYPLRTFLCHLKTLHSHYLYGDLWWKRSAASPLFPSQDCWNTQIPGPTSI